MSATVPLVSVVIPTYNHEEFIAQCLDSVIQQSYENIEIIVSDDASTDGTRSILEHYAQEDNRIRLFLNDKNLGIPANFNQAFSACDGEYVAFLGGDDLMFPDKIEKQLEFLKHHPDYVLVQSDMELFENKSGQTVNKLSDNGIIPTNPLDWVLKIDWNFENKYSGVLPSSCLARANYYLSARYSDELYLKHELLFVLDCYCHNPHGKWGVISEVLGRYRLHESNFSQTKQATRSILMESFQLAKLARRSCNSLIKRIDEYEFYTAYKALLFRTYKDLDERNKVKFVFNKYANGFQKLFLSLGKFLTTIGALGLYIRLNKTLKIFYKY